MPRERRSSGIETFRWIFANEGRHAAPAPVRGWPDTYHGRSWLTRRRAGYREDWMHRIAVGLLLIGLNTAASAQAPGAEDPMAPLRPLVGTWEMVTESRTPSGEWQASPPTTSVVVALLGGKALQEQSTLRIGELVFDMVTLFTYDPFRRVYRVAAVDHQSGMMDVAEGQFVDGALVIDDLRARTFFPWGDGREGAFRLTKRFVGPDHFRVDSEVSFDEGKTWTPYTRSRYTRK